MVILRNILIICVVLTISIKSSGQSQTTDDFEFLSIDRPDISNLPVTVRPGHFQYEIGFETGRNHSFKELTVPNFMLRTGINNKSELRLGFGYIKTDTIESQVTRPLSMGSVSIKYRLVEEKNLRPAIALQPEINFYSKHLKNDILNETTLDLILLFNNTLHKRIFINYNAGIFYTRPEVEYLLSASLSFLHTHRLGYFLELYSIFNQQENQLSFDGGLTFLVSPRLQIDGYFGRRGLTNIKFNYAGFGIGFRLDKGDLKRKTFHQVGIFRD